MPRLRRLCFASAALLTLAAAVVPSVAKADDPDANRPVVWTGSAAANGVHQTVDSKNGVLPVYQPFYGDFPDAASNWNDHGGDARASLYFPGLTGTHAVALICDQGLRQAPGAPCSPPPDFPLTVSADPNNPDARVQTGQTLGGNGAPLALTTVSAVAHYGTDRKSVFSDSAINGIDVVGGAGTSAAALSFRRQAALVLHGPLAAAAVKPQATDNSALHVDSAVAHTKQTYDTDGALLVHAESTLKGVSLGGGMVHIDSIFATSTSRNDGNNITTHDEHLILGGVNAGGTPAALDETGVHIASSSTSAGPLNDALAAALGQAGVTIKVLSSDASVAGSDPKTVKSEVQGVLLHIEQFLPIPNATDTYFTTITLGAAATLATATSERGSAPPAEEGGIGGLEAPAASPGSPGTPASFEPGTPAVPATPGFTTPGTSTKRPRTAVLGNRSGLLGELEADLAGALISHRFELLYLSFTLAFIGLCLSSRLLVPRARQVS